MFTSVLHELNKSKHEEQPTRQDLEKTSSKILEVKMPAMKNSWETLLSREFSFSTADYKSVVFDAPDRNKWFTGRQKELESLERCLSLENSDHKFRMTVTCGLGGCEKMTLAAQFAWKHKPQYEGSVFWFSMEDEEKVWKLCEWPSVTFRTNGTLIRFYTDTDSSAFISARKAVATVLDNFDQPLLSEKMRKVSTGIWKRQSNGHMLITTIHEKKEICHCVNLETSCCVKVFSFPTDEP